MQQLTNQTPVLLSVTNAAKYMGISRPHFYKHVIKQLDRVKIGKDSFIVRDSIDRFISERLEVAPDE